MKLRSQILLFLFLFGFTPLIVALAINLPLVMVRLEWFYHKAYLQNLRADFRDLDQHLASRVEMVRLLAKLPEPGVILDTPQEDNHAEIEAARLRYTEWVNQLMYDQPDIIKIFFFNSHRQEHFQLVRNSETRELTPHDNPQELPEHQQLQVALRFKPGGVLTSPISINSKVSDSDPNLHMTLRLISPIYSPAASSQASDTTGPALGVVIITIDIGGLARVYNQTYWVLDNGNYLKPRDTNPSASSAFDEFPGLKEIFAENKLALWEGSQGKQVIWVPLFATERLGPLWVGREVDPSPISYVRRELEIRVIVVVLGLLITILLCARWFAVRAERFGQELYNGLSRVLNRSEEVKFSWHGPHELRALGVQLTQLSKTHANNNAALHAHAKQLEETNRYKSEFLANVSHELRTPLNSILLLSKLLADSDLSQTKSKQAQIIYEAGTDLMGMIDKLLELARIEARKTTFNSSQVDLPQLLTGLKDLFAPQFDTKGLWLKLEITPKVPHKILTDSDKVSHILKNFLSNAVKFTEHGGVLVKLEKNIASNHHSYPVRISVQDTGIGIPIDKQGLIFETFEQADGSTRRRYGGTGLGLSISRELAHLLGGVIELSSEEGQGSTFALLLPLAIDRKKADANQVTNDPKPSRVNVNKEVPKADFTGKKILIVDDDLRNLLALTPLLEGWGLDITAAGDADEALETLEGNDEFELVLMDIMLPGIDGFEIISRIRRQPHFQHLPIICLTANIALQSRQACIARGANELLEKPVDPTVLIDTLRRYLNHPELDVLQN